MSTIYSRLTGWPISRGIKTVFTPKYGAPAWRKEFIRQPTENFIWELPLDVLCFTRLYYDLECFGLAKRLFMRNLIWTGFLSRSLMPDSDFIQSADWQRVTEMFDTWNVCDWRRKIILFGIWLQIVIDDTGSMCSFIFLENTKWKNKKEHRKVSFSIENLNLRRQTG